MQQPNNRIAAIKIYALDAAYNCFKISPRHFRLRFDTTPPSLGVRGEVRRYADGV